MNAWNTEREFNAARTRNREAVISGKMLRRACGKLTRRGGPRVMLVEDDDGGLTSRLLERAPKNQRDDEQGR